MNSRSHTHKYTTHTYSCIHIYAYVCMHIYNSKSGSEMLFCLVQKMKLRIIFCVALFAMHSLSQRALQESSAYNNCTFENGQ